ncbi:MAG: IPT/TIG domain-containing protein [Thermodesulfobacteriota bacterium]|nr:IPT/TIG domain-containing protein [Thermodesulfobacteriota bacterium]
MKKVFIRLSILSILLLIPNLLYAAPPAITVLTITSGPTEGDSYVGIIGTGFTKDTVFKFDDQRVIFKRFIDETKVYIMTVEHPSEGTVDVTATNSEGTATLASAFTFTNEPPWLDHINLDNGPTEGNTSIHFYGNHFTSNMTIKFGEEESLVRCFYHCRRMKSSTPPHDPGAVDVTITNTYGTDILDDAYTFQNDPPVITRISPESGVTQGGTLVRIWGRNFRATDTWDFGGSPAELQTFALPGREANQQIIDSNFVRVLTSSREEAGTVPVSVISKVGTTTADNLFTYTTDPPEVTTISPNKGFPEGGSTAWIWGNNFTEDMAVDFGGSPAAITRFKNSSLVRVLTSAHEPGPVDVTITTPNGSVVSHAGFTYLDTIPFVSYLWPNNGVVDGGSYVTIRGRNFKEGATDVSFGGTWQDEINVYNSNRLRLKTAAAAAPGAVDVSVTTDEGTGLLENGYLFTEERPDITRIYPLRGLTTGNRWLYIYGTNFTEGMAVKLDNVVHPLDYFYHSGRIRIKTLPHSEGRVDVTVENQRGSSTLENAYEYVTELPPEVPEGVPWIRYISPARGPVSGGTLVTLVGESFSRDMTVLFNNEPANIQRYYDDKKIRILTPAVSSPGPVDITVSDGDGSTTLTGVFQYMDDPPLIKTIIPPKGFI